MPKYAVRVGYTETCYVERDFIVEAANAKEARRKALAYEDVVDEGEEECCQPTGRDSLSLVRDSGDNLWPVKKVLK